MTMDSFCSLKVKTFIAIKIICCKVIVVLLSLIQMQKTEDLEDNLGLLLLFM